MCDRVTQPPSGRRQSCYPTFASLKFTKKYIRVLKIFFHPSRFIFREQIVALFLMQLLCFGNKFSETFSDTPEEILLCFVAASNSLTLHHLINQLSRKALLNALHNSVQQSYNSHKPFRGIGRSFCRKAHYFQDQEYLQSSYAIRMRTSLLSKAYRDSTQLYSLLLFPKVMSRNEGGV